MKDLQSEIILFDQLGKSYQLLQQVLAENNISVFDNMADTFELMAKNTFDLMLVCISDSDGQALIEQINQANTQHKPIIYLSIDGYDLSSLGIDYCLFESLSEPYGDKLFATKVKRSIEEYHQQQYNLEHNNEMTEVVNAMMSLQTDNAKLYDICRFLQQSFFCKDIHDLCEQLFIVTRSFNIHCTLYIHSEKNDFFISDGVKHTEQINHDIVRLVKDEARIFQFGLNRAVFNWSCASLLVNRVGGDVDNLALLMDGFEMGFKAIESVDDFNHVLDKYREQNYQLKLNTTQVIEDVSTNISDKLTDFGATTTLTIDQEEDLLNIADNAREKVDDLFSKGMQLDEELSHIMTKMRSQSDNTQQSKTTAGDDELDGIDFL